MNFLEVGEFMTQSKMGKLLFYISGFTASFIMAATTGCASGGFKLTREYAGWVNSKSTILRVILYILTFVVFAITLLIDVVYYNTMDFWDGRVSAGTYNFEGEGKTFVVHHEFMSGTGLKRSTIEIKDRLQNKLQEVVLSETVNGEIEMYVDGKLRTRVRDIHSLPVASIYSENGELLQQTAIREDKSFAYYAN
jgi:hypothetical protein